MDKIKDLQLQDEIKLKKKKVSPNSKRRERRQASKLRRQERKYKEISSNKGIKEAATYRKNIIERAKELYEKEHQNTVMIREKLNHGEMNQAIRFLYDKGIIKGAFDYYEDFLEQHQNDWTKDEVEQLLNNYEQSQKEAFNEAIDILKGGTTYTPTKRRSRNGYVLDFL